MVGIAGCRIASEILSWVQKPGNLETNLAGIIMETKYKLSTWYWIKHFFKNLKQISLLPLSYHKWGGSKRNLRWRDLPFCTIGSWKLWIPALLRGEEIPRGVILIGGWVTKKEMERINEVAEKLTNEIFYGNLEND